MQLVIVSQLMTEKCFLAIPCVVFPAMARMTVHARRRLLDTTGMQQHSRFPENDLEDMPRELAELGEQIARMSNGRSAELQEAYAKVVDSIRRRRRILSLVQEALSQLRLDIKYLMFDLEVTRKERDELRQQIGGE